MYDGVIYLKCIFIPALYKIVVSGLNLFCTVRLKVHNYHH